MSNEKLEKGLAIRKQVLGEEYVNNSLNNADDFNLPLQELVTEYCWGAVWGREELSKAERSMINLAMISALNRPHELKLSQFTAAYLRQWIVFVLLKKRLKSLKQTLSAMYE